MNIYGLVHWNGEWHEVVKPVPNSMFINGLYAQPLPFSDAIKQELIEALKHAEICAIDDPLVCMPTQAPGRICWFKADGEDGMCSPCRIWFREKSAPTPTQK